MTKRASRRIITVLHDRTTVNLSVPTIHLLKISNPTTKKNVPVPLAQPRALSLGAVLVIFLCYRLHAIPNYTCPWIYEAT